MNWIEKLESAVLEAEKPKYKCLVMDAILCELYRVMPRGFTDSEAEYWYNRLSDFCSTINTQIEIWNS